MCARIRVIFQLQSFTFIYRRVLVCSGYLNKLRKLVWHVRPNYGDLLF